MSAKQFDRRALFASLVPPEPGGGHWVRVHRPAMACRFEVVLDSADARHVPAARKALDEVDAIEAALTYFRETSELARVNRAAAAGPVAVSPELFALLALCRELHAASGGAFDPTSTPLSRAWGFLLREGRVPDPAEIAAARAEVGFDAVALDEKARTVRFARPGLELNLGSIGKGWALDRVTAGLRAASVERALVSAGGSSQRAWGPRPWEVALTSGGETLATLRLRDAAIGTSGAAEQHVLVDRPALRPCHRPAHRLAGGGCPQRDRDRGGRGGRRRARHGLPRRRRRRWHARCARRGRARWPSSRSSASRTSCA